MVDMKYLLTLAVLCLFPAMTVPAQEAQLKKVRGYGKADVRGATGANTYLPSTAAVEDMVDVVLDKYVEVLGGALLMRGIKTRIMRGGVEHSKSGVPGSFQSYAKSPGKSLLMIDVPGVGQFIEAFDGRDGWMSTPFFGAEAAAVMTSEELKRNAAAGLSIRFRDLFSAIKFKGESKLDARDVYLLEGTPVGRKQQLMYFDKKDGLLLRIDHLAPGGGENPLKTVFIERYASVDGLKLPIKIRQVYKEYTLTFNVYEVKHNVDIQDGMFLRPKSEAVKKEN